MERQKTLYIDDLHNLSSHPPSYKIPPDQTTRVFCKFKGRFVKYPGWFSQRSMVVQLAVSFNNLPNERGLIILKNDCVRIFNKRWSEFDVDPYILTYIIHLQYRGK